MGRTGRFTWVRSQGTWNRLVKPNFKINWPVLDSHGQSDSSIGLWVGSGRTGGSGLTGWWTALLATTTTLCWPHDASFLEKSSFVLFSSFFWDSHPDKGWVFLLLTPTVCTKWFQLMFASFGWYVIPAGHFPQKNLSGKPRIGSPFSISLDHSFSYLWPMAHLSCIGWVQVGAWALCLQVCLALLHVLLLV